VAGPTHYPEDRVDVHGLLEGEVGHQGKRCDHARRTRRPAPARPATPPTSFPKSRHRRWWRRRQGKLVGVEEHAARHQERTQAPIELGQLGWAQPVCGRGRKHRLEVVLAQLADPARTGDVSLYPPQAPAEVAVGVAAHVEEHVISSLTR
jgi:hypothetical protein